MSEIVYFLLCCLLLSLITCLRLNNIISSILSSTLERCTLYKDTYDRLNNVIHRTDPENLMPHMNIYQIALAKEMVSIMDCYQYITRDIYILVSQLFLMVLSFSYIYLLNLGYSGTWSILVVPMVIAMQIYKIIIRQLRLGAL